ncbi:class I SAM-dependent methyltransferase [Streptomyces sp. NPDC001796]|uniref:class I SAM-dependent methyltransferase n=1 Tax=Streptomyces sp. NPDC001796 TaxID=3364609 RepID=UPI0036C9AA71
MREKEIAEFWSAHPCGDHLVGGSSGASRSEYEEFFTRYDAFKYRLESHIPECLDDLDVGGRRVLEIGLGQGAESEQLIRRGALWTGIDLTETSVERVRTRLTQRGLPWEGLHHADVRELPFAAGSFDLVFSHGVLHHVPDILTAQREIHRVLRPGGDLVVMLYARWSLNYLLAICLLRRAALAMVYPLARTGLLKPSGVVGAHVRNVRRAGLRSYLSMRQFLHHNTDGPDNPHSRVYDTRTVRRHFPDFSVVRAHKHFMHAPPLPVHGLPGGGVAGWHLWVHMKPKKQPADAPAVRQAVGVG